MTRIAIYCRVSTSDQDPETQRTLLERYARSRKWKFKTFIEVESSQKTRPVKQQVLTALRKGAFTGVLVYKLDRWARSTTELLLEMKELTDKGINFISHTEQIDFSTPMGKVMAAMLGAFAQFERDLISERTKAGMARKKEKGVHIGRPEGSKDKRKGRRPKGGYYLREQKKRNA